MKENTPHLERTVPFFLASFPRAGSTWVRFLIANVFNYEKKAFPEIDFFNIHEIVPEYGKSDKFLFADCPKIFKTHEPYQAVFQDTILILRDPFDTLYSYCDM
ncbi:MAG: sulfotransferase domain-containing protein, partial [Candidatus Aminicenantes bacterium]|nr:sulfotransferase domain-containing protein [Candidatus Aminicenantes bacterium]